MSWDNYGYGKGKWVIDHIIPLSSAKNVDELHSLCYYTNLQPLSWEDNMLKGNKLN
jgi:5-methylcytosine-specific restriction endonuclease McrA